MSPDSNTAKQDKSEGDGWEKVGKNGRPDKKAKANHSSKGNYPAIVHSPNSRIQNRLKISDLQNLALYLLADGPAPQWVSCRHHNAVRKVVVLMVPGLEAGLFDGNLPLEPPPVKTEATEDEVKSKPVENAVEGDSAEDGVQVETKSAKGNVKSDSIKDSSQQKDSEPSKPNQPQKRRLLFSPDDYYPSKLTPERLPEPLKPLADIFPHIWPVRTPGDEKTLRIHSPLQAMLSSPIPMTKEEKTMKRDPKHKGPLPQNGKNWHNKRTSITEYVANLVDLQENEYVLHPAWFTTEASQLEALARRKSANQSAEDGWVDTDVSKLEDGEVPENEIENGSITAGRNVITMDCEMCRTEHGTELTRISVVAWDGSIIMDELVKPASPITDYLTAQVFRI
jgi:RNA exonuclease 1